MYAAQIHHWFQYYPREDFLILNYDDLDRNTTDVYRRIVEFVGLSVDHLTTGTERSDRHNDKARKERIDMKKFFRRYNMGNHNKKNNRGGKKAKKKLPIDGDRLDYGSTTNQRRIGIPMSSDTRAFLRSFYAPYHDKMIEELQDPDWNLVEWT